MEFPEQNTLAEIRNTLKSYGLDLGLLLSGLFGAILLLSKDGVKSVSRSIFGLIGGAASANYLTPIVINVTNLDAFNFNYGIAFLLGFLGLRGIEFICNFRWLPNPREMFQIPPATVEEPTKKRK
jgi:hypothetical protein